VNKTSGSSTSPEGAEPRPSAGTWLRRVKDLPDGHHSTLLAAAKGARANRGVVADLRSYSEHVAALQRAGQIFEKLEIEINLGCNRRCTYCNLATDQREYYVQSRNKTMDWRLFELLIRQLGDIGFGGVLCFHFFAEPLLNKKLGEYARYAREHLPETRRVVYSNGDYLTAKRHRELTDAGISLFFVTRHDNVIPGFLAPVLREPNVLLDTRADMTLNNRGGLFGITTDPRVRTLPCIFTSEALVVTIDGNILPCSCDFRELNRFGNIQDTHIRDIYESEACRQFRQDLLAGHREKYALCRDCDFYCEVLGVLSAAESHRACEQTTVIQIRREFSQRTGTE
jgi:radical SAM protein with 4Fe4S-binding SPASM domain